MSRGRSPELPESKGALSCHIEGIAASTGRVLGIARRVDWDIPPVPHRTIGPGEVEAEIERFTRARDWARREILGLRDETAERIGPLEAKLFESQALMIDDPDMVEGTIAYIRDNYLAAERAFDWRILEIRARFLDSAHAMVLDRLADLRDVRLRVLYPLLGNAGPPWETPWDEPSILVADEVTPSVAVRFDPARVVGFVSAGGSRGSHTALLARALGIPAVVGVGPRLAEIEDGSFLLLDGGTGRIVLDPSEDEIDSFCRAAVQASQRQRRLTELAHQPTETTDRVPVVVQANLDQPDDAGEARDLGARGVGLFRSEFLVIGRREIPSEEEQYEAYRRVLEVFPRSEVTLRTFDIGGDKFPLFLAMPPEENPYLGWRAIRVCLDLPELFRNQLRAAVRAAQHGDLRLLLPFIVSVDEVRRTRAILREVYDSLEPGLRERRVPVGVMVETPAALEILDLLAPHVDFVSLGSNDLTQYVLAADRGNAKLAEMYDSLHPAMLRMYSRLVREAARHELDLGACGDVAGDPIGICVLIGLGYRKFSLSLSSLAEVKEVVRAVSAGDLERLCADLHRVESAREVRVAIREYLDDIEMPALAFRSGLSVE
ncbi:MAG: phosphoenolpyruvate--protein phosphotransferase [Gemmatimonadota bacterium]